MINDDIAPLSDMGQISYLGLLAGRGAVLAYRRAGRFDDVGFQVLELGNWG